MQNFPYRQFQCGKNSQQHDLRRLTETYYTTRFPKKRKPDFFPTHQYTKALRQPSIVLTRLQHIHSTPPALRSTSYNACVPQ